MYLSRTNRGRSLPTAVMTLCAGAAWAQVPSDSLSSHAETLATKIQGEVAAIRGLEFKRPIKADKQSMEEFTAYLDSRIKESVPEPVRRHYGKIVRKLGLYRGPEISDFETTVKSVMTSQAGAYYDPDTETFHVLMEGLPELMLGAFYSHELHHGLQDQHFNLTAYMDPKQSDRSLDGDRRLARQAVVEGEATYVMSVWTVMQMTKNPPPRAVMAEMVRVQSQMDMTQLRAMLQSPQVAEVVGADIKNSVQAAGNIPPFIIETLLGAYFKGLAFVFAVEEKGWSEVDRLYREYPPESTEQILHPEKWFARESPAVFEWQPFAKNAALKQWQVLDDDVLGEFQWRVIFREQGLTAAEAEAVSAGWNGDRYAVFKRDNSDAMLLLLRTSWDTRADADEFAAAYRRLLAVKYADKAEPSRILQTGNDVLVVEGGATGSLDALIKFVGQAKKRGE